MEKWAYVARYGHQQRSELRQMTRRELDAWVAALSEIVRQENPPETS